MTTPNGFSRRSFLKYSALAASTVAMAACAPGSESAPAGSGAAPAVSVDPASLDLPFEIAADAVNPLGVPDGTMAEGVFFQGGYGIDYIQNAADLFAAVHPGSEVSVEGIQGVGDKLRPRFIAGDPPDVIDNSGAGNLDTIALAAEGQLLDLTPLMNAPSLDTPGKTFAETLFPGSQDAGVIEGKQLFVDMAYTVFGMWYSKSLFETNGWEVPATWDELMALSDEIKSAGIAPWTYQGQYPYYLQFGILEPLVQKIGGDDVWRAIDNLEPGAWENEAMVQAINMVAQISANDFLLEGTEALNHTESQAEWLKGNAAFIPCGTWLENEMKEVTPDGFDMVLAPIPAIDSSSAASVMATSGETYFVPSAATNPEAGMEYIRCLLSKESAKFFAENVSSMMPVIGGTEGLELSAGMSSAIAAVEAAGTDIFPQPKYGTWYNDLGTEVSNNLGEVMVGRMEPDEFIELAQAKADETAADEEVTKFTR